MNLPADPQKQAAIAQLRALAADMLECARLDEAAIMHIGDPDTDTANNLRLSATIARVWATQLDGIRRSLGG